jgi:hypothetical protein
MGQQFLPIVTAENSKVKTINVVVASAGYRLETAAQPAAILPSLQ